MIINQIGIYIFNFYKKINFRIKIIILLFVFLEIIGIRAYSQQKFIDSKDRGFTKSITFISEDDSYLATGKDNYYSSGHYLTFHHLKKSKGDTKRIISWQVAHFIYTPHSIYSLVKEWHDRPFAGILWAKHHHSYFKTNSMLQIGGGFGIMGPAALGKETQDFFHKLFNFHVADGWKYQIQNEIGLFVNGKYHLQLNSSSSKRIKLTWLNSIDISNIFTNSSSGILFQYGKVNSIQESTIFHSNLSHNLKSNNEFFFFSKLTIQGIIYDGTIQGGVFNKTSEVTFAPKRFLANLELGGQYASKRWDFQYASIFHTKKIKSIQKNINYYGRIAIKYKFGR